LKTASIFGSSRRCSGMRTSRPPLSTHGRNPNGARGHQSAGQVDDAARGAGGSSAEPVRASLEVADIFRSAGPAYRAAHAGHLSLGQLKVMTAIENCRTAALGGHVEACDDCGHWRIAYNSCRNRHCPKCQGAAARTAGRARGRPVAGRLLPRRVHGACRDRRHRLAEQGGGL
jgi:hypothetical protein